jgi:putative inorganic carbon (hco3(-)) transporter
MAFNSRTLNRSRDLSPAGNSHPWSLWSALQTLFWSPLLLLTAIVHILCQSSTKKFLLGLMILDIPLQCGTHLDLRPDVGSLGSIEGFDFSITTIALFGLYIGWLFSERAESRWPRVVWNWPIVAYTAVLVASLFVASDPQLSLFQIVLMLEMLLLYFYVAGNITSRDEIVFILSLFLAGGLIESIYMIFLATSGHQLAFVRMLGMKTVIYLPMRPGDLTRYGGTTGSPNSVAAYLAIVITLALAIRGMSVPSYLRRLTIPAIVLAIVALAVASSRGGWIEIILSVAILVGAKWLRDGVSRKATLSAIAAITLIVLCLYIPNPISNRFSADDNGSAHSRIPLMHLAWTMIEAHPVLGVGANNFAAVMEDYAGSEFRYEWIYTVHNQYLLVWSETGLIGLAAYLWIYFSLIRRGWRLWKTRNAMLAPFSLGIVAGVCGLLSHMFVDLFDGRYIIQIIWLFMALIAVSEAIHQREFAEQTSPRTIEVRPR